MNEYGCILIKLYLRTLKLDLNFRMSQNIILCCFSQPFKNVNFFFFFHSQDVEKQAAGPICQPLP